ncbi:hypothetical protein [Oricola cellulosilytica]|uniref:Uncharacterized protein n=1 Tax=Oricola cellulosilytica TaxID=1429082 RepID=A0A4V2MNX6_9HYPH|nr:hypothetical protein [Oricola cellulosilytica]TCD15147.1 hypothetical protein E0D97_06255 [Oricola cellulosilytica]
MRTLGNGKIRRKGEGVSYGSGANIKQLCDWDYATIDDAATVETAGHFNTLADVLQVGELIDVRMDLDGTPLYRTYMVATNDGTNVTVKREGIGAAVVLTGVDLTDNSGGVASDTIAAIGGAYSQAEVANAVASLARATDRNTADILAIKNALGL